MYIGPAGVCSPSYDRFWDGDKGTIQLTFEGGIVQHKQWCEDVPVLEQLKETLRGISQTLRW
jgi:hypothetical protein